MSRGLVVIAVMGLTSLAPPAAGAESAFFCEGEVHGAVIHTDLVVRPDEFCIILETTVLGSVKVSVGAVGFHSHTGQIRDDVIAVEPQLDIRILDTNVGGDVNITGTRDGTVGAICRSTIGGSVVLIDNAGDMYLGETQFGGVCLDEDTIKGNLLLYQNSGYYPIVDETVLGDVRISANTGREELISAYVVGNLVCRYNVPSPVTSANQIFGHTVGQCASRP